MAELSNILKAMILSADKVSREAIEKALPDYSAQEIDRALDQLQKTGGDVYEIKRAHNYYYTIVMSTYGSYIKASRSETQAVTELKPALLEVLAIIVLKQPITRTEIDSVRCSETNAMIFHNLIDRGWIRVAKTTATGAYLYVTTVEFLRYFGLSSVRAFEEKFYTACLE